MTLKAATLLDLANNLCADDLINLKNEIDKMVEALSATCEEDEENDWIADYVPSWESRRGHPRTRRSKFKRR